LLSCCCCVTAAVAVLLLLRDCCCCCLLSSAYCCCPELQMANTADSDEGASASAAGSQSDGYDPLKDPRRTPNSDDPGWKYAYYVEPGKRELIQSSLCPRRITGGISRVKQHLVGGYKDIIKCPNTTTAIAKELKADLDDGKRGRTVYLDDQASEAAEEDVAEVETNQAVVIS